MENNIENIISSAIGNPELLEKISSTLKENDGDIGKSLGDVISLLTGEGNNNEESEAKKEKEGKENTNDLGQILELFSSFGNGLKKGTMIGNVLESLEKSLPLLIALKPFLSRSRCELIDTLLKISKLSSIVNLVGWFYVFKI